MPNGGTLTLRTTRETLTAATRPAHPSARPGTFARLTIADTGAGISVEHLPRIFEPFFTTKDQERATGLGLATVDGVVTQHEGWVIVHSTVGVGTTFDVYLPLLDVAAKTLPVEISNDANLTGQETILVVEDDEPVRRIARMLLERRQYRVLDAGSGPAALSLLPDALDRVDLVVTDMVLPGGLSGLELASRLRAARPQLKVILTSGYSVDLAGKELMAPEHVHFLPKPYSAGQLLEAVRRSLDVRPRT